MRTVVVLLLATSIAAAQEAQADRAAVDRAAEAAQQEKEASKKGDRNAEQRALLKKQCELLERRIAVLEKQNPTALGAAELEKFRVKRDAIALEMRRLDADPKEKAERVEVPDIDKLVARAKKGDVGARNALLALKTKIDAVLAAPAAPAQGQVIARNGQVIILNGRAQIGLGGLQPVRNAAPQEQPKAEPKQAEPLPEEERKRLAEIDIEEQEKRAAALEKSIVELTRRAMELERRIEELRAQAAAAEER